MPNDSNEDVDIDKLLAELKDETSEESNKSEEEKDKDYLDNPDNGEYKEIPKGKEKYYGI